MLTFNLFFATAKTKNQESVMDCGKLTYGQSSGKETVRQP